MEIAMDDKFILKVFDEIGLVKDNNRLLIIVSHSFVEMIVKVLVEVHTECRLKNHHNRLEKLKSEKIIDEFQFDVYNWFRELRNEAVHSPLFELTADKYELLDGKVDGKNLQPDYFHRFSISLISELWNKHLDVFLPRFHKALCV
jgi:hypothetical protein